MKVIAVIADVHEVYKILECLKRNKTPPFLRRYKSLLILI